jgi:hypothetical protein
VFFLALLIDPSRSPATEEDWTTSKSCALKRLPNIVNPQGFDSLFREGDEVRILAGPNSWAWSYRERPPLGLALFTACSQLGSGQGRMVSPEGSQPGRQLSIPASSNKLLNRFLKETGK